MKKYNSPIFEIEIVATSDVITTSPVIDVYKNFASSSIGNLDDGSNIDKVQW